MRDLQRDDPEILAILDVITQVNPDILVLTDIDYDHDQMSLRAVLQRLNQRGEGYAFHFAAAPNAGQMTGLDLDQNGKFGERGDAQGYGRFPGDGGMAILSRWPIGDVEDWSDLLWRDLPGAKWPEGWPDDVMEIQRLSSVNHWVVPIDHPDGVFSVLAFAATAPVFDGPEDRNGLRNRDELRLWTHILDTDDPTDFIVAGNANLDPADGEGFTEVMVDFLADPRLQDPKPLGASGTDTADWSEPEPGNLRVSYVLPSVSWQVNGAGVFWPAPDDPDAALLGGDGLAAGPHHLVWVDISR